MKKTMLPLLLLSCAAALLSGCCGSAAPVPDEAKVERYVWVTGLRPEKAEYYRKLHANPWPAVTEENKACHIRNFSIHEREIDGKLYLIAYLEYTGTDFAADMKRMGENPEIRRWWKETDPCQLPLPDAAAKGKIWSDTTQVYKYP